MLTSVSYFFLQFWAPDNFWRFIGFDIIFKIKILIWQDLDIIKKTVIKMNRFLQIINLINATAMSARPSTNKDT